MTDEEYAQVLADAHLAQAPGNAAVRWLVSIGPERDRYEAVCDCGWWTNGNEPVVEDAAHEHVVTEHEAFVMFLTYELANAIRFQRRPE